MSSAGRLEALPRPRWRPGVPDVTITGAVRAFVLEVVGIVPREVDVTNTAAKTRHRAGHRSAHRGAQPRAVFRQIFRRDPIDLFFEPRPIGGRRHRVVDSDQLSRAPTQR